MINDHIKNGGIVSARFAAVKAAVSTVAPVPETSASAEILLIGPQATALTVELQCMEYRLRQCATLEQGEVVLISTRPLAVIVQANFAPGQRTGIEMIAAQRGCIERSVPIFFIAEQDDLTTRLAAVRANGVGYFTPPIDTPGLIEKLHSLLRPRLRIQGRVMILSEEAKEAHRIAAALDEREIETAVIIWPDLIIRALTVFWPDVVIIDMDLSDIDSLELVKVLRQHQHSYAVPIILLCQETDCDWMLSSVSHMGVDIIGKPLDDDQLSELVHNRLRRNRAVTTRLNQLRDRDSASGLYNRHYFLAQLQRALFAKNGSDVRVALMLVALANLSAPAVAEAGLDIDQIISHIAARLRETLPAKHLFGRISDSTFGVLLDPAPRASALADFARETRRSLLNSAYRINGETIDLEVYAGLSVAGPGQDGVTLIQNAERACDLAGKSKARIYIDSPYPQQTVPAPRQQNLCEKTAQAIEQKRVHLMFYPIYHRKDSNKRFKVLLHIGNEQDQTPFAEPALSVQQHQLDLARDRWVIRNSLHALRTQCEPLATIQLFIDLSPTSLTEEVFPEWLRKQLEKAKLPPQTLVFEVQEEAALRYDSECEALTHHLKTLGCGFSLARFGASEDSRALLQSLRPDYVKLDGRFIRALTANARGVAKLRLATLVKVIKQSNSAVIAAGIKDTALLPTLWTFGVDYAQGDAMQRPQMRLDSPALASS